MKILITLLLSFGTGFAVKAADNIEQPPVSRRLVTCDQWQMIGNGHFLWACLTMPREALVAGGPATDSVILSLQDQINKLEARVKELEKR